MNSVASIARNGARWEGRIYRVNSDGSRQLTTIARGSIEYVRYLVGHFSNVNACVTADPKPIGRSRRKPGKRLVIVELALNLSNAEPANA